MNGNAPLIISKIRKKEGEIEIRLVPSLCFKRGLTQEQDCNPDLRSMMCKACTLSPGDRLRFISIFVKDMSNVLRNDPKCMINLGLDPIISQGTRLKKPLIEFPDGTRFFPSSDKNDWRNARKWKKIPTTGTLHYDKIGILATVGDMNTAQDFFDEMINVAAPMAVTFGTAILMEARLPRAELFIQEYRNLCRERGPTDGFDMVLVKLPSRKRVPQALYDSLKGELTFGEYACANQCVCATDPRNPRRRKDIATGVVAQMAGPKKSNKLWSVVDVQDLCNQLCPETEGGKLPMVMALDSYQKMNCLTFTTDRDLCNVKCAFHTDMDRGEMVYQPLLLDAFERYVATNNNNPPNGILFYRVGVSDSQIKRRRIEANEIVRYINDVYESKGWEKKPLVEIVHVNLSATKFLFPVSRR